MYIRLHFREISPFFPNNLTELLIIFNPDFMVSKLKFGFALMTHKKYRLWFQWLNASTKNSSRATRSWFCRQSTSKPSQ
jgi:hypothetical protein